MSTAAITVEDLSKAYRLGVREEVPDTLFGAVTSLLKSPLDNLRRLRRLNTARQQGDSDDTLWALRDVCFEVRDGEVLGVVGHNGAGKSTLLKILSRITTPTGGRVVTRGRVSSLLEVGTGFHPELTGRENVYMNGTILGMSKQDIDRRFDEIVAFSGVEKFLDTPTKRYSSGMQVRLAFAVAAHLEPEVLIIDEVLAVGDAEFQQKCLGRMKDVARSGRTVLFVSHNMSAIRRLCGRAIVMRHGRIECDAPVATALDQYLTRVDSQTETPLADRTDRRGSGQARLQSAVVSCPDEESGMLICGRAAEIELQLDQPVADLHWRMTIYDAWGESVVTFDSQRVSPADDFVSGAISRLRCDIEQLMLLPGMYHLNCAVRCDGELLDHIEAACRFRVYGDALLDRSLADSSRWSSVIMPHRWETSGACEDGAQT